MHLRTDLVHRKWQENCYFKKLKIINYYKFKNKALTNPHIKNHKKSHEPRQIRPQRLHKNTLITLEILNTTNTICGEN
jgi:hypothetical protein